jgi:hypothetical protein
MKCGDGASRVCVGSLRTVHVYALKRFGARIGEGNLPTLGKPISRVGIKKTLKEVV